MPLKPGARTRLPKFKFSANFPVGLGLHADKKKCLTSYVKKNILTENPLISNLEVILRDCFRRSIR